ncbi:hypothetical protein LMORI2_12030 [Limnohabitans sp. MORI2]|uniref:hypothetical protein n=1 Tax=Limnohabitans sp. MORI2 TaxID=1751150 RepID=UPI002377D0C0|nr:hypothetical protein [Limnohabitans sp. MORI2]BDU58221.1 hypothetical protein LMORI2_12030 [Limnohabitans sp. MORI2]
MKIIGKAEQKKIELQIETLHKKVSELEGQLATAKAEHKKLEASASKAQTEAAKVQADGSKALADAKAQLDAKAKELEAKTKELATAQAAAAKAKQEGDTATQAAKADADKTKQALDAANKALADTKAQLDAKAKELEAKTKELATAQAAATKAKQDGDAATQAANKTLADTKAQLDAKTKELDAKGKELAAAQAATAAATKAKQDADAASAKALADAKAQTDAKAKELTTLKAERDKQAKLAQQTEAKYQDSAQENELLLLQLMQAQEELVEYYEQKGEFEKLYLAYKARWERLEKRLPNYLDYGAIEIVDVDGVSDVPSITWQVKDFAQAGVALSEFGFVTVLQDGHPGIGLVKDGQPHAFVPKLLNSNKDHLATFLGLATTEFKQLTAAVSILSQLEAGQWQGFEFPAQFDLAFWRPSIQTLLAQLKQLPALLRYDEVRLKRELINPDYEHLWLEFRGLSLGAAQWKKFEIRLGAALVQADGFSQYPKFEIPLIDGKTKPFDSWYAESQDDSGAKLELRFALDKNVFDVAVWAKLADADKALLLRLIYAMPDALKRLDKQKTAIHRPWATWIDFATGAVKVLEANKTAAQLPATEVKEQKEATEAEAPSKAKAPKALPAPAKLTSTGAKAGKVISITAKPVAKAAPKPKAKPVAAKAPAKPTAKTAKQAAKTARKAKA